MDKENIAKKIDGYVRQNLEDVPFDKALPLLRKVLWDIAEQEGTTGDEIFKIYTDWKSSNH